MHRSHIARLLLAAALGLLTGCIEDQTVDVNVPPTAHAGEDQQLDWDGEAVRVRLDGRGSSDLNGSVVGHVWRSADDGPDGGAPDAALDPDDVARPQLELPRGSYTFVLWATDDEGAVSEPDYVSVRVGTDPVVECQNGLPERFQDDCGSCICGLGDACRLAAAACDEPCWELIGCIADNCPDASDIACITSSCGAFLGGATLAMDFANAGCFEPCAEPCVPAGAEDAG